MNALGMVLAVTLRIVACDQIKLEDETWNSAKAQVIRILNRAGIEVDWMESARGSKACKRPSDGDDFLVVVGDMPPKGWTSPDAMGFAPPDTRRAYVFFSLVKRFSSNFIHTGDARANLGIVLGHAIAHELGHALIPVNAHGGSGIMHAKWSFREWSLMMAGSLLFDLDRAKTMRHEIESRHVPLPLPISERID